MKFLFIFGILSACHKLGIDVEKYGFAGRALKESTGLGKNIGDLKNKPNNDPPPIEVPTGSPKFLAFYQLLENRCFACHDNETSINFKNLLNEQAWIESNYLAKSYPQGKKYLYSKIYYRLDGSEGTDGPKNMPTASNLSEAEREIVKAWIDEVEGKDSNVNTSFILTANKVELAADDYLDMGVVLDQTLESTTNFIIKNIKASNLSIEQIAVTSNKLSVIPIDNDQISAQGTAKFSVKAQGILLNEIVNSVLTIHYDSGKQFTVNLSIKGSDLLTQNNIQCNTTDDKEIIDYVKTFEKKVMQNNIRNILGIIGNDILNETDVTNKFSQYPDLDKKPYLQSHNGGLIAETTQAMYDISEAVANKILNNSNYFQNFMNEIGGACNGISSYQSINSECMDRMIDRLGRLAFSRDLSNNEKSGFKLVANDYLSNLDEAFKSIVIGIMIHPKFLFIIDTGANVIDSGKKIYQRSTEGHLRMIAVALNGRLPDHTAIDMAMTGKLNSQNGFNEVISYLKTLVGSSGAPLYKEKAYELMNHFFALEKNSGFGNKPSMLNGLLQSYTDLGIDLNQTHKGSQVADAVFADQNMLWVLLNQDNVNVQNLLVSKKVIAPNALIQYTKKTSTISPYQQTVSDDVGGMLFSNALLYYSGGAVRIPMHLGAWYANNILCEDIPSPDPSDFPGVDLNFPEMDGSLPVREVVDEITGSQSACFTCHEKINAVGFSYGNFNSAAEKVDEETFYDNSGVVQGIHAIDTSSELTIHGQKVKIQNAMDLADKAIKIGTPQLCMAQYAQHDLSKSSSNDSCEVKKGYEYLKAGGTVNDLFSSILTWDSKLKTVRFE